MDGRNTVLNGQSPLSLRKLLKVGFLKESPSQKNPKKIILWADTFNNHFHPQHAKDAARSVRTFGI